MKKKLPYAFKEGPDLESFRERALEKLKENNVTLETLEEGRGCIVIWTPLSLRKNDTYPALSVLEIGNSNISRIDTDPVWLVMGHSFPTVQFPYWSSKYSPREKVKLFTTACREAVRGWFFPTVLGVVKPRCCGCGRNLPIQTELLARKMSPEDLVHFKNWARHAFK